MFVGEVWNKKKSLPICFVISCLKLQSGRVPKPQKLGTTCYIVLSDFHLLQYLTFRKTMVSSIDSSLWNQVFDEFASQLGLKPLEKRRLEKAGSTCRV